MNWLAIVGLNWAAVVGLVILGLGLLFVLIGYTVGKN